MASPGALPTFAGSSAAAPSREILEISSDSDSDSSIVEPDSPNPFSSHCRWRTSEFYDQECSRFFDCPSHTVERAVSDDEADPQEVSPADQQGPGQEGQPEANSGVGRSQASPINTPSSPRGEASDAGARASGPGNHSGVVIDLTASPAPEDRDVVMSAPPKDDDVVMSYSPDEADGGARLEGAIRDVQQLPNNSNADSSASTRLPPHEVIDLTRNDTPPPPSPIRQAPDTIPAAPPRHRPSLTRPPGSRPQLERAQPSEISLPRWQPDAEATLCPICRTQFSFFVRKHHCRKCGRVVCNACSPHRITIPYQYIVQQPEQPRLSSQRYPPSYVGGEGSYGDFNNSHIGGGERVRLCNPCVPDPNITPPQPQQSPNPTSPRNHGRSQSNVSIGFGGGPPPPSARFSSYFAPGYNQGQDPLGRHRSITHSGPGFGGIPSSRAMPYNSAHSRIHAGTPPSYFPPNSSMYPGAAARGFQSMLDIDASSSSSRERALPPPPPPPQLDEEDECPVCHRELPSRTLPNFEAVRESHITSCIMTHSAYVSGGTPTQDATPGAAPPFAMRLSGIFPYIATEKDCVDSAECTICLEEFEEGVEMARLECLCRFHLLCIKKWFKKHPGRCPVHQHDSFGY